MNYLDAMQIKGTAPIALGLEGAGVVEAVDTEVTGFGVGDHVAYPRDAP